MLPWYFLIVLLGLVILGGYLWYRKTMNNTEAMSNDTGGGASGSSSGDNTSDKFYWQAPDHRELKCVLAGKNGKQQYCVRDTSHTQESAELLAKVVERCAKFVNQFALDHPHHPVAIRLKERFEPDRIHEILPNSQFTAFSENKGENIALCLTPKKDDDSGALIDEHTLTFVALHELAHVATISSEDHGKTFWDNFAFLLAGAEEQGIHKNKDYRSNAVQYCGLEINDNPYFSRKESRKGGAAVAKGAAAKGA